jgi:hypothetical protein
MGLPAAIWAHHESARAERMNEAKACAEWCSIQALAGL